MTYKLAVTEIYRTMQPTYITRGYVLPKHAWSKNKNSALGHKGSLIEFQMMSVIQITVSDLNAIK